MAGETLPPLPPSRFHRAAIGVALLAFVIQAALAATRDSVTVDEFVHVPVGLHVLETGDTSLDPINPPLSRVLDAIVPFALGYRLAAADVSNHWGLGYELMRENAARYHSLFVAARSGTILLAVALALLAVRWCHELHGADAAVATAALCAFSPALLAHGHLATVDLAGALGFTGATALLARFLERPSAGRAATFGAASGAAVLLKLSNAALAPLALLLAAITDLRAREASRTPALPLAGAAALVVVNAGYGFADTPAPLALLSGNGAAAGGWHVPLPATFLEGVALALRGDQPAEPTYFLAGELSTESWWTYHLVAFTLKTPVPFLALVAVAVGRWIVRGSRRPAELALFAGLAAVFVVNGVLNPLGLGARHLLAAEPLLCIAAGAVLAPGVTALRTATFRPAAVAAWAALGWIAAASLWIAPRYLEYFNPLAGGPAGGHRWLVDSNLDWGQDLVRLSEFMERRSLETVDLAYFGRVHPGIYGISFRNVERGRRAVVVISPSLLMGRPYVLWDGPDQLTWSAAHRFEWLRDLRPSARVGALFVYDLTGSPDRAPERP